MGGGGTSLGPLPPHYVSTKGEGSLMHTEKNEHKPSSARVLLQIAKRAP